MSFRISSVTPSLTHYNFKGWSFDKNYVAGKSQLITISGSTTSSEKHITLDLLNGKWSHGKTLDSENLYTFELTDNGEGLVNTAVLYAVWEAVDCTITLIKNNESVSLNIPYNSNVILNNCLITVNKTEMTVGEWVSDTAVGLQFAGWGNLPGEVDETLSGYITVKDGKTYYATFKSVKIRVEFLIINKNGDEIKYPDDNSYAKDIDFGVQFTQTNLYMLSNIPNEYGETVGSKYYGDGAYDFANWYYIDAEGKMVEVKRGDRAQYYTNENGVPTLKLYANFVLQYYIVSFKINSPFDGSVIDAETIKYEVNRGSNTSDIYGLVMNSAKTIVKNAGIKEFTFSKFVSGNVEFLNNATWNGTYLQRTLVAGSEVVFESKWDANEVKIVYNFDYDTDSDGVTNFAPIADKVIMKFSSTDDYKTLLGEEVWKSISELNGLTISGWRLKVEEISSGLILAGGFLFSKDKANKPLLTQISEANEYIVWELNDNGIFEGSLNLHAETQDVYKIVYHMWDGSNSTEETEEVLYYDGLLITLKDGSFATAKNLKFNKWLLGSETSETSFEARDVIDPKAIANGQTTIDLYADVSVYVTFKAVAVMLGTESEFVQVIRLIDESGNYIL